MRSANLRLVRLSEVGKSSVPKLGSICFHPSILPKYRGASALNWAIIKGETMTFNILHEDWGPGTLPFHNQATVRVTANEMRLVTQQDNMPAP